MSSTPIATGFTDPRLSTHSHSDPDLTPTQTVISHLPTRLSTCHFIFQCWSLSNCTQSHCAASRPHTSQPCSLPQRLTSQEPMSARFPCSLGHFCCCCCWSTVHSSCCFCCTAKVSQLYMYVCMYVYTYIGFPGGSEVKASACNVGDLGSIPGSGRSPGEGNGNPPQYSCLENPMDGGAW